jgi:GMP synthase-like glutamine amidotransferase
LKKNLTIGLLECDHVRPELIHIAGDYRQMFPNLFGPIAPNWSFVFFDVVNGHFPESVDACDAYICTGSSYSVYDEEDWIIRLKLFVNQLFVAHKIYLGVCFGHQLLAEALGGKVQKAAIGWCVGVHEFEVITTENWMQPSQSTFNLLMMCQDQVLTLPPNAVCLAATPDCSVAMFRVGQTMMGVQAHPEFSVAYETALMALRTERIGQKKINEAQLTLQKSINGLLMTQWMVAFVEEER